MHCTCGSVCSINVFGVSENCTLTNHGFFKVMEGTHLRKQYITDDKECDTHSSFFEQCMTLEDISTIFEEAVNKNETSFPRFLRYYFKFTIALQNPFIFL